MVESWWQGHCVFTERMMENRILNTYKEKEAMVPKSKFKQHCTVMQGFVVSIRWYSGISNAVTAVSGVGGSVVMEFNLRGA